MVSEILFQKNDGVVKMKFNFLIINVSILTELVKSIKNFVSVDSIRKIEKGNWQY